MSNEWGRHFQLSIFGESHGPAIGIVLSGLPAGFALDLDAIAFELSRRAPGRSNLSTPRREEDFPEILSGFFEGKTTGAPLCAILRNRDTRSRDYSLLRDLPRPGHADYTAQMRYCGFQDYRVGGHFSGRITAPLVFAGAVAKQILRAQGIEISARIASIRGIHDAPLEPLRLSDEARAALCACELPTIDPEAAEKMREAILCAKREGDSVGGVIECWATGVPAGTGNPFFDSLESDLAHVLFSIPAIKGVEFGLGFEAAERLGSEVNDAFCLKDGEIACETNFSGGVQGGIANGMPLLFRVAVRPTPSIAKKQKTVSLSRKEETEISVPGRHDPCIVPRAVPVVEAACAIVLYDQLKEVLSCRI